MQSYLRRIGVPDLPPATAPFDPGYAPDTVESHLRQSAHLMEILKLSMACWQVAGTDATSRKLRAARRYGVPTVAGGGPFEVAVEQGALDAYLDLCGELGFTRIECGSGFTDSHLDPVSMVARARARGLDVQYELGNKHDGPFDRSTLPLLLDEARRWLDAGAVQIVVEARESARGVGLFDDEGVLDWKCAEAFATHLGIDRVCFEAPLKASQFAFLDHFGNEVHLSNVRLEELLRVEIYRRGLHSDAFRNPRLRPAPPTLPEPHAAPIVRSGTG